MEHKPGFDSFTDTSQPGRTPWSLFIVQFSNKLILINSEKMFLKALSKQVIDYNMTQNIAMKTSVAIGQERNPANNETRAF